MSLEPEYKNKILGILIVLFPDAKIYLFGSRARGTHSDRSDIDIAIDEGQVIRPGRVGEAVGMFSESNIPYKIDIVDFYSVSDDMQYFIKKEGIVWKS